MLGTKSLAKKGMILTVVLCALCAPVAQAKSAKKPIQIPEPSQEYITGKVLDAEGKKNEAREHFEIGAEKGDAWCMTALGVFYENGWGGLKKDSARAFELVSRAAAMNHPAACRNLGCAYIDGRYDVSKNTKKALEYLNLAATKLNDAEANFILALMYFIGSDVARNTKKGLEFMTTAVNLENDVAMNELGVIYLEGRYKVPQDEVKGLNLIRKAAKLENPAAIFNLASYYLEGKYGLPLDLKKGTELLMTAAEKNQPNAVYLLGKSYLLWQYGLPLDEEKGIELITKAAEMNFPRAINTTGMFYLDGMFGFKKDIKKGLTLVEKAAGMGDFDAFYKLGYWNLTGAYGMAQNTQKAVENFSKAADMGDIKSLAMLGHLYSARDLAISGNRFYQKGQDMIQTARKLDEAAHNAAYRDYAHWHVHSPKNILDDYMEELYTERQNIITDFLFEKNKSKNTPDYSINCASLFKEFNEDYKAAEKKYKGKTVRVKGYVLRVGDMGKYVCVTVFAPSQPRKRLFCYFDANRKKEVVGLENWNAVELKGVIADTGGSITMAHSQIVSKK